MRRDEQVLVRTGLAAVALLLVGLPVLGAEQQVELDLEPILEHNQAWLHPSLEGQRNVSFTHRMEPVAVKERFAWRRDGTSLVEILERQWGAEAVGRQWVTTPEPALHLFAPGSKYASNEPAPEGGFDRYLRDHLMGTHTSFVALDWGWKPESFTVRNVRRDENGRLVVQLVPHESQYHVNAGAMFHTGSSAYVHDVRVGWGELTIDPQTRRILREADFSVEGKKECEIEFLEWRSIGSGREVPLRIHLHFPEHDFDVDYRFQWREEGLWILTGGTSQFEGKEPQREEICDLAIDQPEPILDAVLARIKRSREQLQAAITPPTTIRLASVHRFQLGKKVVLAEPANGKPSPVRSLLFTFPDEQGTPRWPRLVAEMLLGEPAPKAESGAELLLTLLDKLGRPMQVHRAPLAALQTAGRGLADLAQSVREHNALWLAPGEGISRLSYTFQTGSKSQEFSVDVSEANKDLLRGVGISLGWSAFVGAPERFHAPVQFTGTLDGRDVVVVAVAEPTYLSWGHGLARVGYVGGYHSTSAAHGLLVVEKDSCRPLVSRYGDVEIHFLNYVEVRPGVSAPLRIVIFSGDGRDDFRFQILDGRAWLFDRSYSGGEPRARTKNVSLDGSPAQVTARPPDDVPPVDQLERLDWSRITDRRSVRPSELPLVSEIIAQTRPWEHPSYKPLLGTKLTVGGSAEGPLLRLPVDRPWFYKEIGYWTLTWLEPGVSPRPLSGPETLEVPAYPWKLDERVAVNVSSGKDLPGWEGIHTRINSYSLAREDVDLGASVEIVSLDKSRGIWAPVAVALADEDGRLLAAASDDVRFIIRTGIYSTDETLRFGRVHGIEPKHVLLGLQAVVTSAPMGSTWGTFFHEGPWFAYEQLLGAEDPRVWGHGVRSLYADLRKKGLERDELGEWWRDDDAKRKEMLKPHLDQLQRLLRTADDPEALALVARLAGHSGDPRFRDDLAKLLDHPQPEVQDAAAVGLGLLGDPRGIKRLRPILGRPLPEHKKDYEGRIRVEAWQTDAALALAAIGSDEALHTLGDVLLETVKQLREEPAKRGTELAGPVETAEIVTQVLGGTKSPVMVDYFKQVLQSDVGRKLAYLMCPHLSRVEDKDAVRDIFLEGIRRGEASFIRNAPLEPVLVKAVAEVVLRPGLDDGAFWSSLRYLGASRDPEATEALRQAFDQRLFHESERMRLELIEALAERGDYRGLSEAFERLVEAVDPSTLPEEAQAREKEERHRRGRAWDLVRLVTGKFPAPVVAEYLRPRKDAEEPAVRQAVEKIVESSRRIEVALTTTPQRFPESVVQLSHVDETAEGKQSYGGTGFGVRFTRPEQATHVVTVELYGSRYGYPQPPAEDFHVYLLDENQKLIRDLACPYARVERGQETWYTFATPPTEVPREFFVGLWFDAHQTKGVYVGKDTTVKESHSYTGTPEKGYQPVGEKYDWMVRVRVAPKDVAEKVAAVMAAATEPAAIPAPLLAAAEDQAKGREILKKVAEVNRYWLSSPPPAVRTYSYVFQLEGSPPKKIEVDAERSAGGAARQGISYTSPIHQLIRDPARVSFRRVEVGEDRITLEYMLAEAAPVAMGTGISGSWRGYFSTSIREGTLVVDPKRWVPLEHNAKGLRETWSQYVELDADQFAPLSIDIDTRFAWKFRVYDPGLWLFAFAADKASEGETKRIASVDDVRVNGEHARIKHAPQP